MYIISKEFHFSAAHQLKHLPEGHQCARLHGHNYIVKIVLRAREIDERGFVVDYGDLGGIKTWIDEQFDHKNLDDVVPTQIVKHIDKPVGSIPQQKFYTTAENIAWLIYHVWKDDYPELYRVEVSETPKTWAIYCPEE